jgi:hypothetical protein
MFRKQPISGFFLWNDLVVQARYSMEAFFAILSAAVVELWYTDVMAGSQIFFSKVCIRIHEISE